MTSLSKDFTDLPFPACIIRDGLIRPGNRGFARLAGYSEEELSGRPWVAMFHPEDQPLVRNLLTGEWMDGPRARLAARDGTFVNVQLLAAPLDGQGQCVLVIRGNGAAPAGQEEAQAKVVLEDLLQNISDIVHIHSVAEGRLSYINQAFPQLFGYRVQDWLGRSVRDLVAPQFRHLYDDYARKLLEEGHHQGVMCLLDAWGKERFLEYSDVVLQGSNGSMVRGIAHEVTERITRAKKLEQMLDGITLAMADLVEQRDPYTSGHQKRVAEIAVTIAQQMGWPEERLRPLFIAASLHDIGKISIPTEILAKPATLTVLERKFIEQHPQAGADILRRVPFPWDVAGIILSHHERLDGSGYPRGLKGNEIDQESRILAVADVYEAMTTHRPYRPALSTETALAELSGKSDILYDGKVVRVLVDMIA